MTIYKPVAVTLAAIGILLSLAYLGKGLTAGLVLIGIMAMLVHAIEPNLAAGFGREEP